MVYLIIYWLVMGLLCLEILRKKLKGSRPVSKIDAFVCFTIMPVLAPFYIVFGMVYQIYLLLRG